MLAPGDWRVRIFSRKIMQIMSEHDHSQSAPPLCAPDGDIHTRLCAARRSIRAFLPDPVPDDLLLQLLVSARQAPSGANLQPGSFLQVSGAARERLTLALLHAFHEGQQETEDYSYFPDPMPPVYRRRQVAAARAL